jgi:hypothetical protein
MGWSRKPATVSTDTVIPMNYSDSLGVDAPVLDFTMRFDDVLDVEKLRTALERLLEIGDWKKIGARIRKNVCFCKSPRTFMLIIVTEKRKTRVAYPVDIHKGATWFYLLSRQS